MTIFIIIKFTIIIITQDNKINRLCIHHLDLLKDYLRNKLIKIQMGRIFMNKKMIIILDSPIYI